MSIVTRATAKTYFETGDTPTQAQFGDLIDSTLFPGDQDMVVAAYAALGSSIKALTLGANEAGWVTASLTLVDARYEVQAIYLPVAATLTGVMFVQNTQGNFTGDNTNGIGLYSYSGGTLTKVAESANNANIWKGTTASWQTVAFASTYAAAAGLYFIVSLYNNSAQTTAPVIGALPTSSNGAVSTLDFTNSAKLHGTLSGQTTLTSTISMASVTTQNTRAVFALY